MTWRSPRTCSGPHCRYIVTADRPCPKHGRQADQARPSASARGYLSTAWRTFRAAWLARFPYCGDRLHGANPMHSRCVQLGERRRATDVDHIERVAGPDDPAFFDPMKVQSLCHSCHARKTAIETHRPPGGPS